MSSRLLALRCLAASAALSSACAAAAVASGGEAPVMLESMTSPELAARIAAGTRVALIPIGGTEQNGPHMTLGKHNGRVQVLVERIARRVGDAVVAPTLAYVPEGDVAKREGHLKYAGTLSVPPAAFIAMLQGAAASLCEHGITQVFLLGDHGGYQADLQRAAQGFKRKNSAGQACHLVALRAYYDAVEGEAAPYLRSHGVAASALGEHAGATDTALALATVPQWVRSDWLAAQPASAPLPGASGDARQATRALGEAAAERIVAASVRAIVGVMEAQRAELAGGAKAARR